MRPICFFCHEELHYISNRRMMCYNKTCEKIYGLDYACTTCSAKKQLKVLAEVVATGKVCCPLCGNKGESPELNLETMMRSNTISRIGERNREKQGQGSLKSIPPRTFHASGRDAPQTDSFRAVRYFDPSPRDHKFLAFSERAEPYIEETDNGLTIIIEFPRHTLEQIQWRKEGTSLIIESAIVTCLYRDEITLPNWVTEPTDIGLSNGFLTIKFTK